MDNKIQNTAINLNRFNLHFCYMPLSFVDTLHSNSMCQKRQASISQHELYSLLRSLVTDLKRDVRNGQKDGQTVANEGMNEC